MSALNKANRTLLDAIRQAQPNKWATNPQADDVDEPLEMTVGLLERLLNAAKSGAASAAWIEGCRSGSQSPWND